jgi:uncharacterized protein YjiS (DUF1127 family)
VTLVVGAERVVGHEPSAVYDFLARLANHHHLGDRYLQLASVDGDQRGGRIVIGSPVGIRRTASTKVTTSCAPEEFGGTASVGRRTQAQVLWRIEPAGSHSLVSLQATVHRAGFVDRALFALGGRWWLRRRFRAALGRLDRRVLS